MSMKIELADYVLCLSNCAALTKHANDRPLYQQYLADAAVLLASAVRGINREELKEKVELQERLLSQSWLAGPEHKVIFEAWGRVKNTLLKWVKLGDAP
jgi:hypothetical protein